MKHMYNICKHCNKKIAVINDEYCNFCYEDLILNKPDPIDDKVMNEVEKCKSDPYYFATTYLTINGKKYTTPLTRDEFNQIFNQVFNREKNN